MVDGDAVYLDECPGGQGSENCRCTVRFYEPHGLIVEEHSDLDCDDEFELFIINSYDDNLLPTRVENLDADDVVTKCTEYHHDAEGRMTRMGPCGAAKRQFFWEGIHLVKDTNEAEDGTPSCRA